MHRPEMGLTEGMGNRLATLLAAWGIEQEQVIKCRLAKGPEVTFQKQIQRETAHGKTHHPLLPLVLLPCSGALWLLCIVSTGHTTLFSVVFIFSVPQDHLTGSSLFSEGALQNLLSCESRHNRHTERERQRQRQREMREMKSGL